MAVHLAAQTAHATAAPDELAVAAVVVNATIRIHSTGIRSVSSVPSHCHIVLHLDGLILLHRDLLLNRELLVLLIVRLVANVRCAASLVLVGVERLSVESDALHFVGGRRGVEPLL